MSMTTVCYVSTYLCKFIHSYITTVADISSAVLTAMNNIFTVQSRS